MSETNSFIPFEEIGYKKKSGVYMILNTKNEKVYIGQTRDLYKRIVRHISDLNLNKHANVYLQNSWNKRGLKSFSFFIVEYCDVSILNSRESYWMNYYSSYDREYGYNLMLPNKDAATFNHSKETRNEMSKIKRLYTDEEMISYLQEFYYMEGRIFTYKDSKNDKFKLYPKLHCYASAFGSYENAIIEAGLADFDRNSARRKRDYYTEEIIIEKYKKFIEKYKRFPNTKDRKKAGTYGIPTARTVIKVIGSMEKLREKLGHSLEFEKEVEREKSLKALSEEYNKTGFLTHDVINNSPLTRSIQYYTGNFGTLEEAFSLAGIDFKENRKKVLENANRKIGGI